MLQTSLRMKKSNLGSTPDNVGPSTYYLDSCDHFKSKEFAA